MLGLSGSKLRLSADDTSKQRVGVVFGKVNSFLHHRVNATRSWYVTLRMWPLQALKGVQW